MAQVVWFKKKTEATFGDMLQSFFMLTKPTITLLVVISTLPGILLASAGFPTLWNLIGGLLGASLASASAAVFNQVLEAKIDQQMERTQTRSLPKGKVTRLQAICFGGCLLGVALFLLYNFTTPLAAIVALVGHLFYVVVYTLYLKHRTAQNIVIGGAAGAVGPLIGWTAVTGSFALTPWILFLIIFLWTPPHFWALALKYKYDYAKVGIPMYPILYGDQQTCRVMFIYTLLLFPAVVWLYISKVAGPVYLLIAGGFTLKFMLDAFMLYKSEDKSQAMPLFHFSCLYILGVFGALTVDRIIFLLFTI